MSALLLPNDILSLSAQAAKRLISAGNGDGALLYLALLDCGGDGARARKAWRTPTPCWSGWSWQSPARLSSPLKPFRSPTVPRSTAGLT